MSTLARCSKTAAKPTARSSAGMVNKRATCGALAHVLEDFCRNPEEVPSVSQTIDGESYLDFLATLKFCLKPHIPKILAAEDRVLEINKTNLDVQVRELTRQLQKTLANEPSLAPMFVYGTIAYNRTTQPDTESIEHFLRVGRRSAVSVH